MLKPLGDRVVLKVEEKEQKVGGFVIAGAGQDATKEAKVIAVGQGIRTLNGELVAPSVKPGDKVVVIGDGAVGQCAVIAAKMRGASQIVLMSRHEDRQKMALESGATAVVAERGQEGIAKVRDILGGGADVALECVGTEAAVDQALGVLHNGGRMGFVGVPHYNNRALGSTFAQNITVAGGAASVTTYDKQILLKAVLDGDINPGRVFTSSYKLEDIDQAYKDMDERKTIKAMIVID